MLRQNQYFLFEIKTNFLSILNLISGGNEDFATDEVFKVSTVVSRTDSGAQLCMIVCFLNYNVILTDFNFILCSNK